MNCAALCSNHNFEIQTSFFITYARTIKKLNGCLKVDLDTGIFNRFIKYFICYFII